MWQEGTDVLATTESDVPSSFTLPPSPAVKRAARPPRLALTAVLSISAALGIALLIRRCVYKLTRGSARRLGSKEVQEKGSAEKSPGEADDSSNPPATEHLIESINEERSFQAGRSQTSATLSGSGEGTSEGVTGGIDQEEGTPSEAEEAQEFFFGTAEEKLKFLFEAKGRTGLPEGITREKLIEFFTPRLGNEFATEEHHNDYTSRSTGTPDQLVLLEAERLSKEGRRALQKSEEEDYLLWLDTEGDDDVFTDE
ncbi:hypothetical protein ACSSS7_004822 [Eimeria intestinalis]